MPRPSNLKQVTKQPKGYYRGRPKKTGPEQISGSSFALEPGQRYKEFIPHGAAIDMFLSHESEIILSGSAGTGKSRACLEKLHLCALKYPGMRALIARKSRTDLTQSAMKTFDNFVLDAMDKVNFHTTDQEYQYPNGSCIVVGGLDKATKVMSAEYDMIYVNEATEVTENDWEAMTSRLRGGKMPYQQMIADCNPDAPTHWLKKRADSGRAIMFESFHQDNPVLFDHDKNRWTPFGKSYLDKLRALSGVRYARLFQGKWISAEGAVYDGWDRGMHVIDSFEPPEDWKHYWSVDFGFTAPFVWQDWVVDHDGRMYLYKEIYMTQRLVSDHAKQILEITRGEPRPRDIICDHDAEGRATLSAELGMITVPAYKAISDGIQAVAMRLRVQADGKPRLMIMRDALIQTDMALASAGKPIRTDQEPDAYVWDSSNGRKKGEAPIDEYNHGCLVAGTMIRTIDGEKPIETVKIGDMVATRQGFRCVVDSQMTSPSAVVKTVEFSDGTRLTGTGNHPVWVEGKGWVPIDSLRYADIILTWKQYQSKSHGTALFSGAIRNQKNGQIVRTISRKTSTGEMELGGFTKRSGNWQMVQFHPGITSTTRTLTHLTTISKILSAFRQKNTRRYMHSVGEERKDRSKTKIWKRRERLQRLGTLLPQVENGISSIGRIFTSVKSLPIVFASNVAKHSSRSGDGIGTNSAQTPVSQRSAGILGSMTRRGPALGAKSSSRPTNTPSSHTAQPHVVSVTTLSEKRPVYNLTVEAVHEYFANGVLVKNCDAMRYACAYLDRPGMMGWIQFAREEVDRAAHDRERVAVAS